MTNLPSCPSSDELQRFLLGRLAESDAQRVQQHLAGCTKCLAALHNLESQDTLVSAMQAQGQVEARSEDAIVQGLVARLGGLLPPGENEADATIAGSFRERPGMQLGPYKLLQQIGEGGMGAVWIAEQRHPVERKVALKVIKPGQDSRQVVARFEAERQALALMDHPHIAKVLDAGATDTGRPYFVMELVTGVPITHYCDERQLTLQERLALFVPVCQAVQHAHQKGIIHRDLKPTNVLVAEFDGRPVPKVIDFGVAKATGHKLTERTLFTEFGQVVGTLEYMSPEQAEANPSASGDIDTRSDIYSLGVLLYELLTGSTPLERKRMKEAALLEVLRFIREEEPPRPSTRLSTADELPSIAANRGLEPRKLSGLVRGELDWIVMKALEKDRNRRYETANSFAADVQRYLADEPVQACPPSAWYRFGKFARRNKSTLAVAGLVLFFLILLGSGAGWAVRDRAAREVEQVRERDARELAIETAVNSALKEGERLQEQGAWPEARSAVKRAEGLLAAGGSDELHERVRDLLKDLEMVLELEEIHLPRAIRGAESDFDNAAADAAYARAFRDYGIDVESLDPAEAAERIRERRIRFELTAALDKWTHQRMHQATGANWHRLVAVARAADPDVWRNQVRDALPSRQKDTLTKLAALPNIGAQPLPTLSMLGGALDAVGAGEQSVAVLRQAQQMHPGDFDANFQLAWALDHGPHPPLAEVVRFYTVARALRPRSTKTHEILAQKLAQQGNVEEAKAVYRQAIELAPKSADSYIRLGKTLNHRNQDDLAIDCFRKALELAPKNADAHIFLGAALSNQKRYDEAIACFRKALELEPKRAAAYSSLGMALYFQNEIDEAFACFDKAIELAPESAGAYMSLGIALCNHNKFEEAITCFRKSIEFDPNNAGVHRCLADALYRQGKLDEAIACYRKAAELAPESAEVGNELARVLSEQGKLDEAIACYKKVIEFAPENIMALQELGNALKKQGKLDEADPYFKKVIEHRRNDTSAPLIETAEAHIYRGMVLDGEKKFDEAIAAYRKAIELEPKNVRAYTILGTVLHNQKKLDEAIACYRKVIEIDSKNAEAHCHIGLALDAQGKRDEAIECYKKAIELAPRDAEAHFQLGRTLCAQNKLDEAIACYKKVIEFDPENIMALQVLGQALQKQGKLDEAGLCFKKVLNLRLNDPRAPLIETAEDHINRGLALDGENKFDEAIAAYRKAIELAPKDARAHTILGTALHNQNKFDEAIACYRKVLEIDSKNAEAHCHIGLALDAQGKRDEAIDCYKKAIELAPKYAEAHIQLGRTLCAQNKLDEAVACYKKVITFDPENTVALEALGQALQKQGKLDEAVVFLHKSVELGLKNAGDHNDLAWRIVTFADAELRDFTWALALAKKAIELEPKQGNYWNTLGVAHYRVGQWKDCINALKKPDVPVTDDLYGLNAFFLAMAHCRLGDKEQARIYYDKAVHWMDKNQPMNEELRRFRAEAEELLGVKRKVD